MDEPTDATPLPAVTGAPSAASMGLPPAHASKSSEPLEGLPNGAVQWVDGTPFAGCKTVRELPPDTRVWYKRGAKGTESKSAKRYIKYQDAGTVAEAKARNPS